MTPTNRLEARRDELPEAVFRRCRHIVGENGRVLSFVRALERGRIRDLGPLMSESHRSLRDDYQVSCPELEAMLEAADGATGREPEIHAFDAGDRAARVL